MLPQKLIKLECVIILIFMLNTCGNVQTVTINYDQVLSSTPFYYGWEGGWINEDSSVFLERYQLSQPNIIRLQIPMFSFEPVNDNDDPNISTIQFNINSIYDLQYNRSVNYDRFLRKLIAQHPGICIYINIWDCANWLATTPGTFMGGVSGAFPPNDYDEYKEFVRAVAFWLKDSIGFSPEKILFTFVNEPNSNASFPTHAYTGNANDLILMAQAAREALNQVSAQIKMGGIEEWMSTNMTQQFMNLNGGQYIDFLTYHVYQVGVDEVNSAISSITNQLTRYDLPIYLSELGDNAYGSSFMINYNSIQAGIDLTKNLITIWQLPLSAFTMFRLNNTYIDNPIFGLSGWIGYGLFEDWRGTHTNGQAYSLFPGFWSFANFFNYMNSTSVIQTGNTISDVEVLACKRDSVVTLVAVNSNETQARNLNIAISTSTRQIFNSYYIYDGLTGTTPIYYAVFDSSRFSYSLPAHSVRFFRVGQNLSSDVPEQYSNSVQVVKEYRLTVFPNPANSAFAVHYALPSAQNIRVRLLDVLGRIVLSINQGFQIAGQHRLRIDTNSLSSGLYFLDMSGSLFNRMEKIVIIR